MLKKLILHEWKETWKVPALIVGVTILLSLAIGVFFYLTPPAAPDIKLNIGNFVIFMLYFLLLSSSSLLITVYLGIRFYKNLYTDEGYLMHTLPVRPWMLLASKSLAGSFWSYLGGLIVIVVSVPLTIVILPKIGYIAPEELGALYKVIPAMFGGTPLSIFMFLGPFMLVGCISSLLTLYAAISMGQLFPGHKVLASILCYLGLNTLVSAVFSVLLLPGMTGIIITKSDSLDAFIVQNLRPIMQTTMLLSGAACVIIAVAAFLLCNYIMEKCLNLD